MQTAHGIIVRLTKLTETSLIVTVCVDKVGIIKVVAKGARRPKSQFSGKLDLFYNIELSWSDSKKSELGALRELIVNDYAEGIRKSYKNTMVAGYFASLVEWIMESGTSDEEIYQLLNRAYAYLSTSDAQWKAVIHFEKELAKLLGVWDQVSQPHACLSRAFGALPRLRSSCEDLLKNEEL